MTRAGQQWRSCRGPSVKAVSLTGFIPGWVYEKLHITVGLGNSYLYDRSLAGGRRMQSSIEAYDFITLLGGAAAWALGAAARAQTPSAGWRDWRKASQRERRQLATPAYSQGH